MNYKRIYLDSYSYYLTVVIQGRKPLLIDNIELLRDSFKRSKQKYSYTIEAIVILPDHLHMIIRPKIAVEYSKIISHIKDQAKSEISHKKYKRGHSGIWQERFYEYTIRDEKDWLEKVEYIRNNPIKHNYVTSLSDWKYSSVGRDASSRHLYK